jgi:5-formyltetrahydrofolate cyclo-ligase
MPIAKIKRKQKVLRDSYRQKRREIPSDDRAILHKEITRVLLTSAALKRCETIAAYLNLPSEVNLSEFIGKAQKRGQSVCVPVVDATRRVMEFRDLPVDFERQDRDEEDLVLLTQKKRKLNELDCALIPLLVFDSHGNRIGMGGGYYDKFFENSKTRPLLIGIAYELQKAEKIIPQEWDIRMDMIASEQGLRRRIGACDAS